ncbi:TetR/AcrR family transcriptional regulator [Actinomadura sp. ATCC 31491]|uniref:TetR/AcrR family transcriptional regulator n=1 Tax=Actinomadura luzonensis TaxID=2805427 RepID=A0ABT0G4Q5_9ACTN|nr:TetR/AcrR family transcriptional regulator [Actinomadura luzonensis]MCK2219578.1 TetR/AcrR family transcriptional regulator [Actinomadura luzonensis]
MGTRERIVDAAEQVIREFGIAGATTKRIAAAAGCSEALLYKHFPGKEKLLLAVLLERLPALGPALTRLRLAAGTGDVAGNLTAFTLAALEFYTRAAGIAAGVIADPSLMAGFRAMLAASGSGPHLPILALAEVIADEQRRDRVDREIDPGAAASMLMGACFHRANLSYYVDPPGDDAAWAATLVDTLLRR